MTSHRPIAVLVAGVLIAASCGGDDDDDTAGTDAPAAETTEAADDTPATDPPATDPRASDPPTTDPPTTEADPGATDGIHNVPDEFPTIQAAVDASSDGDLVLIAPGTYNEAVDIVTPNLTIRGLDRDGVVLDGEFELDNGIRVLGASGVVVENLTAQNYTNNGVFWIQSTGYRASHINTYRTGDYGIYAFDSVKGQIDNSHTIGSRDAGIYIGQCYPCDAVVDNVISSHNGLGYSGTNSGGNLLIVNSVWHDNRAGIVPNSGSYELCYPERETTIVGNLVYDNNNQENAAISDARLVQLNGIVIAGGIRNIVERNRVDSHDRTGIALVPYPEEAPNDNVSIEAEWEIPCDESRELEIVVPDGLVLWQPWENVIRDNVVSNSGDADIGIDSIDIDLSTLRNCFSDNVVERTAPSALQELAPCDGDAVDGDWTEGGLGAIAWLTEIDMLAPDMPWQDMPLPELGRHEGMADPATAPARPATDVPFPVDLDAIEVPELPAT
jgi:hypothetical protein